MFQTSAHSPVPGGTPFGNGPVRRAAPPALICVSILSIFVLPSNMVIDPLGAAGTGPMILACMLLVFWIASWIWGVHDPIPVRHPGRLAVGVFALGTIASSIALSAGWSGLATAEALAAADRWLILVAASTGLVLAVGERVRTLEDALGIVRWVLAGAFFCCLVGAVQFVLHVNPVEWIQVAMVGFRDNGGDTTFQPRGDFVRVAGTTFHSIEFAVVSAMLLPLSIWRALYDRQGRAWFHWLQTGTLLLAVATTVSRTGTLGAVVAIAVFVPFAPRVARQWILTLAPIAVAALFVAMPGFLGTLISSLFAGESDPSITTRLNNYPRVAIMIDERPWLGLGPGNYTVENALQILDNQYLNSAVSVGIVGLACVAVYLWLPALTAIDAARRTSSPALRALAGAIGAGLAVAAVCSATFDSLSFPVFALLYPLLVGLGGGVWRIVGTRRGTAAALPKGLSWIR